MSRFGADSLKFIPALKQAQLPASVIDQFIRASTAVGANFAEARAAESRADFLHKLRVALKECRETKHWLEILREIPSLPQRTVTTLFSECDQRCAILYASIVTSSGKTRQPRNGHVNGS